MTVIRITAAELVPGDDNDGDVIATVDVGRWVYLTYVGDDTRIRVPASQVYTVERVGGVSTVPDAPRPVAPRPDRLAAEAAAGARRERDLLNDLRRERRRYT